MASYHSNEAARCYAHARQSRLASATPRPRRCRPRVHSSEKSTIQLIDIEMPPGKNITLRRQARKIIYDVYTVIKSENAAINMNETQVRKRAAELTKTSLSTVNKIIKEASQSDLLAVFRTPGKQRNRSKPITNIDNFDQGVIKRCIHNFHITNKTLPTVEKLRTKLRSDINFKGSERSLRRIIKNLGFKWRSTENNRKVLIEKSNIRLQRINYLQKIEEYRRENRPIIYSDETYVHATHTTSKQWSDGSAKGLKKPISKGQRVVIVHAGSEAGFVPNALAMFKSGSKSGDYHDDMNFDNYQKWLRTQLIPNLPARSVLVVDNAAYHNKQYDSAPNSNSKKAVMQAWLTEKGIPFTPNLYKPQLYDLIKLNKDRFTKFNIDKLLSEHNHDVLRLPPYHPDLNPIEMAWAAIKGHVSSNNVEWNVTRVMELVREKVDAMGSDEWQKLCDKIKANEGEYRKCDHVVDCLTDSLVIRVDEDSDSSSSSDSDEDAMDEDPAVPGPSGTQLGAFVEGVVPLMSDTDSD